MPVRRRFYSIISGPARAIRGAVLRNISPVIGRSGSVQSERASEYPKRIVKTRAGTGESVGIFPSPRGPVSVDDARQQPDRTCCSVRSLTKPANAKRLPIKGIGRHFCLPRWLSLQNAGIACRANPLFSGLPPCGPFSGLSGRIDDRPRCASFFAAPGRRQSSLFQRS